MAVVTVSRQSEIVPNCVEIRAFEFSGWHNGGGTFGLRVLGGRGERDRFRPWRDKLTREGLDIVLPAKTGTVIIEGVSVTPSYWTKCPSLRDLGIRDWMLENQIWPWPDGDTPKYIGELNPDGARVALTVSPAQKIS